MSKIVEGVRRLQARRLAKSVKRYGKEPIGETGHQLLRAMSVSNDATPHLVYADYLEENGKPHMASIIRDHVHRRGEPVPHFFGVGNFGGHTLQPGEFGISSSLGNVPRLWIYQCLEGPQQRGGQQQLRWHVDMRRDKMEAMARKLISEGAYPTFETHQKVGETRPPDEEIEEPRFLYARAVKRYSMGETSKSLHAAMETTPNADLTPHAAYADFLEENSKPFLASVIRDHVLNRREAPDHAAGPIAFSGHYLDPGEFGVNIGIGTAPIKRMYLYQKNENNPDHSFKWYQDFKTLHDLDEAIKAAMAEGAFPTHAAQSYVSYRDPNDALLEGEMISDPENPRPPRRIERRRFAAFHSDEEQSLQRAMEANPEDMTPALAYADWLEENGRSGEAAIVRKHMEEHPRVNAHRKEVGYEQEPPVFVQGFRSDFSAPNNQHTYRVAYGSRHEGSHLLSVSIPLLHSHGHTFYFSGWFPHSEAIPIVKNLQENGLKNNERGSHMEMVTPTGPPRPESDQVERLARAVRRFSEQQQPQQPPQPPQRVNVTIKGEPYVFVKNAQGWQVGAMGKLTDRFHRNYQVTCDETGTPVRCSCPDNFYRGGVCKHMKAAAELKQEAAAQAPQQTEAAPEPPAEDDQNKPVKMSQHDDLLKAHIQSADDTAALAMADHMEENGVPGAQLLRAGIKAKQEGFRPRDFATSESVKLLFPGDPDDISALVRAGGIRSDTPYLNVRHFPSNATWQDKPPLEETTFLHKIPVHSHAHLRELLSDLPPDKQQEIAMLFGGSIPNTHETTPEQYARRYAAYVGERAPAGGIVVRGKAPDGQPIGGTFYQGGKLLPDLRKLLTPERKSEISKRLKKKPKKVKQALQPGPFDPGPPDMGPMVVSYARAVKRYAQPMRLVGHGESAHQALSRLLGSRDSRRVGKTAQVYRLGNGDIAGRLHNTNVVVAHQNGQVTLNHGGWPTRTTARYMAGFSGLPISFRGGKFLVNGQEHRNGERFPSSTSSGEESLLKAIRSNPEDNTTRLAYADWLEENGRSEEANQIRQEHGFNPERLARAVKRYALEHLPSLLRAAHHDPQDDEPWIPPGQRGPNGPEDWYGHPRLSRLARAVKRYAAASGNIQSLLRAAREDPRNETLHGAIADAIEEEHPGNPFPV